LTGDIAAMRGAAWTLRALRRTRRSLHRDGLRATVVPAPPNLPAHAGRGVSFVLGRTSPTCLERSLVLQRWLASQGVHRDVVIGVARMDANVAAHAWLEGESGGETFHEISRVHSGTV
jgi:Transglutaminase-like superfamily